MPRLNNQFSLKQRRHKRTLDFCGVYTLPEINRHRDRHAIPKTKEATGWLGCVFPTQCFEFVELRDISASLGPLPKLLIAGSERFSARAVTKTL
jgi:hypothetical protein